MSNTEKTIWNDTNRVGNFTSSKIGELMTYGKDGKSFGKPALTYVKNKNRERRLQCALDSESLAKPLSWGKVLESGVFSLLGLEYSLISQETIKHPTIPFWSGSPDGIKTVKGIKTVIDIKACITRNSFCDLVDPLYEGLTGMDAMNDIRENHKEGETYYWQLISNAILTNSTHAELVVYLPYKEDLDSVRELAGNYDGENLHKYYWIANAQDNELPFLIKKAFYKDLNIIRFKVSEDDKKLLTNRVLEAGRLLINPEPIPSIVAPEEKIDNVMSELSNNVTVDDVKMRLVQTGEIKFSEFLKGTMDADEPLLPLPSDFVVLKNIEVVEDKVIIRNPPPKNVSKEKRDVAQSKIKSVKKPVKSNL